MEFHEKLQKLRKQKGLTQEELAGALYVSRTAISKWESGRGYPSIDSLKAIARFYGVTIDELLSGKEALTIAEEESRQVKRSSLDMMFGLLDCSAALFFFLPLFGQRAGGAVRAVSLLALRSIPLYIKAAYFIVVIAAVILGISALAFQNCRGRIWERYKNGASMLLGAVSAGLFAISRQPYAAAFALVFLMIKGWMLMKQR